MRLEIGDSQSDLSPARQHIPLCCFVVVHPALGVSNHGLHGGMSGSSMLCDECSTMFELTEALERSTGDVPVA